MDYLFFDFETYSKCDLKLAGGYSYSKHPSTGTLCLALIYKKDSHILYMDEPLPAKWVKRMNSPRILKIAHNLLFDFWIYNHVFAREQKLLGNKIPDLKLSQCYDSMASAYYYGYPGKLEEVAKLLHLDELKFKDGRRAMLDLSRNGRDTKNFSEKLHLCGEYCLGDTRITRKIIDRLELIDDPLEYKVFQMSLPLTMEGIGIDLKSVKTILNAFYWFNNNIDKLVFSISKKKLVRSDLNSHVKLKKYFLEYGVTLENTQKDYLLAVQKKIKQPHLKQIIDLRVNLAKASINKLKTMEAGAESSTSKTDKRVRGSIQYYGSHTGRYAGRGFQPLNLFRETLNDKEFSVYVKQCREIVKQKTPKMKDLPIITDMPKTIRRLIIAKPGYELTRADYGQIEARVVAWLAGEETLINDFLDPTGGEDVYCTFASYIYNRTITKKDKTERQVGKTAVLGLGFGMGHIRYADQVMIMTSIEISPGESQRIVNLYRNRYNKVQKFWYLIDDLFRHVVTTGKTVNLSLKYAGFTMTLGWSKKIEGVYITLPAGRSLYYPNCKLGETSGDIKYWYGKLYGGKLTENIVQAIARDIMTAAMLKIPGVVLPVHDELVIESKTNKNNIPRIKKMMSDTAVPKWFKKELIEVDIAKGKRYDK
jgi:DNA polymerase